MINEESLARILAKPINELTINEKIFLARHGYKVSIFVHDEFAAVRSAVIDSGKLIDVLVHDENAFVRAAVASAGYFL